jgi:ABC-2 type transport system permease protein
MYISLFKTHNLQGSFVLFEITTGFFSGRYLPIPLMPEWLQNISVFMPFRYTSDLPFRIYSGHIVGMEALSGILIEIIWILALFALGRFLMRRAEKKVIVFGG